jgi:hypothetical protein
MIIFVLFLIVSVSQSFGKVKNFGIHSLYDILYMFKNPPRVIFFPNPLPVLYRDVLPCKCPDDSLVFGCYFFRSKQLIDFVKVSGSPVCLGAF